MKVSVLLTSYNHEKYIRKSIESVLNQTFSDFQLIIVDDCSTDSSWDIINEFKDERIVAIKNHKNLRTEGIYSAIHKYVKGDYFAMHHSDDMWMPDKLDKQVRFMENHPDIAACFTKVQVIDEEDKIYADREGFYYNLFNQENRSRYEWLNYFFYHGNCLCHPSVLMRSKLFFEDEMFDFGFAQIPDFSRWVRICLKHDIYIYPEQLTKFRIQLNGKNTSGNRPDVMIRSSIELYHLLKLYLKIPTAEEFIKVFPEGMEYADEELYIPQFAYGRICTRPEMNSYTRLYGYELLYSLMNDRCMAQKIEEHYGFTFRDLITLTGEKDIFHVLDDGADQCANIYFDFGDDFQRDNKIEVKFYLNKYYFYDLKVKIPSCYRDRKIRRIRFDPAEGIASLVRLDEFKIDDNKIELRADNLAGNLEEFTVFETPDPYYLSEELDIGGKVISIKGEIRRLDFEEQIDFSITQRENIEYLKKEIENRDVRLNNVLGETDDLKEELQKRDTWLEQLINEKHDLEEELQKKDIWLKQMVHEKDGLREELQKKDMWLKQLSAEVEQLKRSQL